MNPLPSCLVAEFCTGWDAIIAGGTVGRVNAGLAIGGGPKGGLTGGYVN